MPAPRPVPESGGPIPEAAERRPLMTNLVLLVLVVGVSLWVMLGEPETRSSHEVRFRGRVFEHLAAEDVNKIEIERADARIVLSRPTDGRDTDDQNMPTVGWMLSAPVADRADDSEVNKLLNTTQYLRSVPGGKVADEELKDYPFGEVVAKITLGRQGKPAIVYSVGKAKPGAIVPVRDEVDGSIYHVKKDFLDIAGRKVWVYRDKQLVAVSREAVTGIVLEQRGRAAGPGDPVRRLELVLERGRWRVGSKAGELAADAIVAELLDQVCYYRAAGVAKDGASAEDLKSFGLAPPSAKMELRWTGEVANTATLLLGAEVGDTPQERYGQVPERPGIVYVVNMAKLYAALQREPADYLNQGLFPIPGGEVAVDRIRAVFADAEPLSIEKITKENDWKFTGAVNGRVQLAKNADCTELARALLQIRVRERLGRSFDAVALGVDDPDLTITIGAGALSYEVRVGAPVPEKPGVYYVARQGSGDDASYAYTADLADMPFRLRDAPLELRHPSLFKASQWNVDRVALHDETGRVTFAAEKRDPSEGQDSKPILEWFLEGDPRPGADEQLKAFLTQFDDLQTEKWVALDSPQARRSYGLATPRRMIFRVATLGEDGQLHKKERILLLGERSGQRLYAMAQGGAAIGLIDAGFLDRIARGFSQDALLFEFTWFDVTALEIKKDGARIASFAKGQTWIRDRLRILDTGKPQAAFEDDVLKPFERTGVNTPETATAQRLDACGLTKPAWELTFTVQPTGGAVSECILRIGNREGLSGRARWATTPGNDRLGSWFDGPLRSLETYLEQNPAPKAPEPRPAEDDRGGRRSRYGR